MATRATARVARTAHADSMTYNPKIHHRRSIRLKGYDYSRAGAYFITICIVGAYKSLVANGCLEIFKSKNEIMGKLWHRNYHEHIIRDEESYQRISNYIINNPSNWKRDKFFLK